MPLRTTLLSIGTFSAIAATSMVTGHRGPAAPALASTAEPVVATSDLRPIDRVDDAVAAAVIQSITRQFDTSDVVVQLGDVHVRPASIQDRSVTGDGRLRIDGGIDWIPFRFAAMYDTASAEVTYPQLDLGSGTASSTSTASPIAASLDRQVTRALQAEFQSQPVRWSLGEVRTTGIGRFTRVQGSGTADFGADGSTPAQVEGLYDTAGRRWVRVHYELGPAPDGDAIASL